MFKKSLFFIFLLMATNFLILFSMNKTLSFSLKYFETNLLSFNSQFFTIFLDKNTIIFFSMVSLVTCLVCLYSEIYMEHYNNKKFFLLMILFFVFMNILSSSASFLVFFLGWDGLGLSSICLIMFYPNKTTLYNSILTMVFNRLGDVILIFMLSKFLFNYSTFMFLSSKFSGIILILLLICSFTKSAQFPLSSWLPAAMSAPTPISAMVHSSTLVTAGVLLNQHFIHFYMMFSITYLGLIFCFLTFLLGGVMGVLELDFKKVIAFSTMSQISMILFFCFSNFLGLSMMHMFFHAFFKTLLFVSAGMFFMYFFSMQGEKFLTSSNSYFILVNSLLFVSIFNMSGISFSSSFFSKDLVLESFGSLDSLFFFAFMMIGSMFTIKYSMKLFFSSTSFLSSIKMYANKKFFFLFFMVFLMFVNFSGQLFKPIFFSEKFPNITFVDLSFMNFLFLIVFLNFFSVKNFEALKILILSFTMELSFMKFFSYSIFSGVTKNFVMKNFFYSDTMMFKSFYLNILKYLNKKFLTFDSCYIVMGVVLMIVVNFMM